MKIYHMQEFSLIGGQFTAEEAKEVLSHLLSQKIQFHQKKIHSSIVRNGQSHAFSEKRVEELKKIRQELLQYLDMASSADLNFEIEATVKIKLTT